MRLSFLIRIALRAINRNKLRAILTMLGILIGVASVIAMVAIGQGASKSVKDSIASMGNNLLLILPGSTSSGGISMGLGTVMTLTSDDGNAIATECPAVAAVSPIVHYHGYLIFENKNWIPGNIEGGGMDYPIVMNNWQTTEGRWWTEQEVRSAAKVCLIGQTILREVFDGNSPVGLTVKIGGIPIKIIGVLKQVGSNAWGRDQDDVVVLPWTTIRRYLNAATAGFSFQNVERLSVTALSGNAIPEATKEVTALLRERHHLKPKDPDDFTIRDLSQIAEAFTSVGHVMTILLAAIASISLLVGGIGIMNIMLVSVSERTREIGIRMAVGAQPQDILLQFLVESIVLALCGGAIGVVLGVTTSKAVSVFAHWPTLLSIDSIIIALGFATLVGVVFGYYPALRASKLDPIECLRYE